MNAGVLAGHGWTVRDGCLRVHNTYAWLQSLDLSIEGLKEPVPSDLLGQRKSNTDLKNATRDTCDKPK